MCAAMHLTARMARRIRVLDLQGTCHFMWAMCVPAAAVAALLALLSGSAQSIRGLLSRYAACWDV